MNNEQEYHAGDLVHANYKNSKFTGTIESVDTKHKEARVVFSPGVDMILPLSDLSLVTEKELENGTYSE